MPHQPDWPFRWLGRCGELAHGFSQLTQLQAHCLSGCQHIAIVEFDKSSGQLTWRNLTAGLDAYVGRSDGADAAGQQATWPITDHLGSVLALMDQDGAIVTDYRYGPYGQTRQTGAIGATNNAHQYTGRERVETDDQSSPHASLYYYRARYYDAELMRFISQDPIREEGGNNLYAYVDGNPVSYTDPLGLQSDRRPRRPGWPDWAQPPQPNYNCATAECAAGLPPTPSDNRSPTEMNFGQCKMVCQISLLVPVAMCNAAAGGGLAGTAAAAAGKGGLCTWICT